MKLRQKKTNNLSEQAFYLDFQNQHFQTFNRNTESMKKTNYEFYNNPSNRDMSKTKLAQILSNFIANCNMAKQGRQRKSKTKHGLSTSYTQSVYKTKRIRKSSENVSFNEQKKIEQPNSAIMNSEALKRKKKSFEKTQQSTNSFSINKMKEAQPDSLSLRKQLSEQNIINNFLIGNTLKIQDYARFIDTQYFALNPLLMSSWYQISPFFKPNLQNSAFIPEQIKNGLFRQLSIHEIFNHQSHIEGIQKKPLSLSNRNKDQKQKSEKKPLIVPGISKISPDKVFKRASYHVGIAYSIYMDNIQKKGKLIKNFSDIDPTRPARQHKNRINTY